MIRVDVASKSYGETRVLQDIHFGVSAGETLAVLGPSGIGKSTLLRLVSGIDDNFEGAIVRPKRIAMVFQEPTLMLWRSAFDNIRLIHPHLSNAETYEALDMVALADKAALFPRQLSLGQQRRLALARGFAGQPELLIMDEPFVSLDAKTADQMIALTEALISHGRPATIFVTHAAAEAERLATRTLSLAGSPATLAPPLSPKGDTL
jgi:ABC-type nitrate/sulfonate/bicarbonate transport system ATPase subunit